MEEFQDMESLLTHHLLIECGPITQNVEDAAILYDIIAGHDEKDSTSANIDYKKVTPKI